MKHTQSDLEAMRDEDETIVSVFHSDKKIMERRLKRLLTLSLSDLN